jgi:hypothetical protein
MYLYRKAIYYTYFNDKKDTHYVPRDHQCVVDEDLRLSVALSELKLIIHLGTSIQKGLRTRLDLIKLFDINLVAY